MKLLIAGGGTGGHLFSGIAVAEEWKARGGEVLFVGTTRGLEKNIIPSLGFDLKFIAASPLKGRSLKQRAAAVLQLPKALAESLRLVRKFSPQCVLGIGGYASGPILVAAKILGLKTYVLDQNSIPGWTNRTLGRFATKVFTAFEEASSFFDGSKVCYFGNPVPKSRIPSRRKSFDGPTTLLVCGGSQGAHALNERMVEAAPLLVKKFPDLVIIHQTGVTDLEWVKQSYGKEGIAAEVGSFFNDMEEKYLRAHLVVSRSGAGTLTEIALWGIPSLLIPYPFSADGHQQKNAEAFVREGAAEIIEQNELTTEKFLERVTHLLSHRDGLMAMGTRALALARPDAAKKVVEEMKLGLAV